MRTCAAVCVAAKHLARNSSTVVGIIGSETSARGAARMRELFGIDEVRVMSMRRESRETFAREQSEALG